MSPLQSPRLTHHQQSPLQSPLMSPYYATSPGLSPYGSPNDPNGTSMGINTQKFLMLFLVCPAPKTMTLEFAARVIHGMRTNSRLAWLIGTVEVSNVDLWLKFSIELTQIKNTGTIQIERTQYRYRYSASTVYSKVLLFGEWSIVGKYAWGNSVCSVRRSLSQ